MTFTYDQNTAGWEPWQHGYRYGVILIRPPEPLRTVVNALRSRHDPKSQSYCDAHISVTVPLPEAITDAHWAELETIASHLHPFEVRYGPLKNYLPHPGVCLEIAPQTSLDHVRGQIEAARAFANAPPRKYPYSAHMTIAEFITAEQTMRLMDELNFTAPTSYFVCEALSYMVPDDAFRFTERAQLALGKASANPDNR